MSSEKNPAPQTQPRETYGAGEKSKTNPGPSSLPSSEQTNKAKPIGKGKAGTQTDRA